MPSPTKCTCTLNIVDLLGANVTTAELVCEPRKSFIQSSSTNLVLSRPQRTLPVAGVCTMILVETATSGQKVIFTLNYDDGNNPRSVVFDPITIPNQASVDLSTLLSISRG